MIATDDRQTKSLSVDAQHQSVVLVVSSEATLTAVRGRSLVVARAG